VICTSIARFKNDDHSRQLVRPLAVLICPAENIEAAGPGVGFRVPAQRRFFVAGLTVTPDLTRYHTPRIPT